MRRTPPDDEEDAASVASHKLVRLRPAMPIVPEPVVAPAYAAVQQEQESDLAVTLQRYLRIAIKQKWLILGVTLFITALGSLNGFMKTPLYTATVTIQIDAEAMQVVDGDASAQTAKGQGADFQRTHYELLKSRAMAERVVSALQLQEDTEFLKARTESLTGWLLTLGQSGGDPGEWQASARKGAAVGTVASQIAVRPVAGSRLVNLSFTDPSPARAARIANAYAEAYVAANLDKRFDANSYAKVFLEDQVKQLKLRLEDSENALLNFAEQEKIVEANDKESLAETNLAAANAALGQLISERIRHEQNWRQVEKAEGIHLPQLLTNNVIDDLRARVKDLKRDYEEKLETFKPGYPAMVEISKKMKEVERQITAEVTAIKASLKAAYESSLNQEGEMRARIDELRAEVLDLQKKSIRHNILTREVETNRGLYNNLLQRFKQVDIASGVGTNNIFIVDKALPPGAPSEPRMSRILMLSLMLGLGAGLGLAYLLEIFDNVVRTPEEVEQISGLATLGIIPLATSDEALIAEAKDPRSPVSEAYRSLGTALQFSTESGLPRSIVVTSSAPKEGKSTTALSIARHFALMGSSVLLVDADLRNPSLHVKLGTEGSSGLSNYLTGNASSADLLQRTEMENLKFIAAGPVPPNAGDLLGGTRMFSFISAGLKVFDLIIIDSPPMLGLADAQLLSSAADATVFVVSAGQSRKGAVQSALRRLQLARTRPVGVVLTKFDSRAAGYGYGYGYGYGADAYGYGATPEIDGGADERKIAAFGVN